MAKKADAPTDPLEKAIAEMNTRFGPGSVITLGSTERLQIESITTGSMALDHSIGVGGIPRGRVTEIYGPESSGKSTLALGVVANAQRAGLTAAYIDAEHAVDLEYAERVGVDPDKLLFSQPDSGEQGLITAHALASTGKVGLIVVDSVPALVPEAEIKGEIGDPTIALLARLMSQALRMLVPVLSTTNTACVFINQLREKPGVNFGPSEVQPGGRALKFYSSVRLDIRRIETLKSGSDDPFGNRVRVKAVKNKVAPPLRLAEFDIRFGQGIDWAGELVDLGVNAGLVRKNGAFYQLAEGVPQQQGREAARRLLHERPDVAQGLIQGISAKLAAGLVESRVSRVERPVIPDRSAMTPPDFGPVEDGQAQG